MKKLSFLLFCLGAQVSYAQFSLESFKGRWKESTRQKEGKTGNIEFADTMRFDFMDSGYTMLRWDNGPTLVGDITLTKTKMKFKDNDFEIKQLESNELVLVEKGIQHRLQRVQQFAASPVQKVIPNATDGEVNLDFATLKGKWSCYRKTDPAFDKSKMYIKQLDIKDKVVNAMSAQLSLHNMDTLWYEDVSITIEGKQLKIKGQDTMLTLTISKSDAEELVAEDRKVTYYFKRFGKKNTLLD